MTSQVVSEGTLLLWMELEPSRAAATLDTPQATPWASLTESSPPPPSLFYTRAPQLRESQQLAQSRPVRTQQTQEGQL